jgi:glycosyltransferase involved in cell wall biosynthesis
MIKVYLEGPPDNWTHGLATAKKLRLKYKPPETIYLININKLSYNFIWFYSRPSRLILDNLSNGLSYAFFVGKGGRGLFLQNIDLAHIITYTGGQLISFNKPTIYEIDTSPIDFLYYYHNVPLEKLKHLFKYLVDFFKDEQRIFLAWQKSMVNLLLKLGFPHKIEFIPPPFPIVKKNKDEEERKEFRILFVGYNFIDKGGLMAVKTFKKVKERVKSAKLIIVSKRIPPEINCEGIEFLGPLENKILREKVMPSCDISLIPYLRNRPGVASLLESMAAGLPIIATYTPLFLDFIIDGKTGYLVKDYNEEVFSRIIIDLIENKDLLHYMRENCIKYIKDNHDPLMISNKLYAIYRKLC